MAVAVRAVAAPTLPRSRQARRRPASRPRLIPASRVRRRGRLVPVPLGLLSLLMVTGILLLLTGVQVLVSQGAFHLSELTDRAEQLQVERDLLRLRVARLSSPDRVARAAGDVGLVLPEQVEVLPSPTRGPALSGSAHPEPASSGP